METKPSAADGGSVTKGGARRALLVGINNYPGFQSDLPSCVADAEAMGDLLSRVHGYQIEVLVDEGATRAGVLDALQRLCTNVQPADRICFYYSGHGATIPRLDSIEECLVLADGSTLPDDDFVSVFTGVPAGTALVMLDSCFSGGMSKEFQLAHLGLPKRMNLLTEQARAALGKAAKYRPFGSKGRSSFGRFTSLKKKALVEFDEAEDALLNALLLSACLEGETASASTPQTGGLSCFTYALLSAVANGGGSTGDLILEATEELRRIGAQQTPQIKEPAQPLRLADASFPLLEAGGLAKGASTARTQLTARPRSAAQPNAMTLASAFLSGFARLSP